MRVGIVISAYLVLGEDDVDAINAYLIARANESWGVDFAPAEEAE